MMQINWDNKKQLFKEHYELTFNFGKHLVAPYQENLVATLKVHYDGLYDSHNEIPLADIAESWQGLARVLAGIADMVIYQHTVPEKQWRIQVTTKAELKPGSIWTVIYVYAQQLNLFEGLGTELFKFAVNWLFNRKGSKEKEQTPKEYLDAFANRLDGISQDLHVRARMEMTEEGKPKKLHILKILK